MQINLEKPDQGNTIRHLRMEANSYRISIGENDYSASLIITPRSLEMWEVATAADIQARHFDFLEERSIEVLLLGTGKTLVFPPAEHYRCLLERGVGVEVMDTPAACRTYNLLAGDGRRVAAALIL
jgi:uncharacterized protein